MEAIRSASATPASPNEPAESSSSTTVACAASAASSASFTNAISGRSSAPSTFTMSTLGVAAVVAAVVAPAASDASNGRENASRRTAARRGDMGGSMVPSGSGYPRGRSLMRTSPPAPRRAPRLALSDRWAFKPVAFLLLVPVVVAAAGLTAFVISPPFLGLGYGIQKIDQRLQEEGASFTRIPPIPQRSTIYASDGTTVLAHVYLDNREIVPLNEISPYARSAVLAIEDSGFYQHGALNLTSLVRARRREPPLRHGRAGRLDDHAAAREEHPGPRSERPDVRAEVPGGGARDARRADVLEGPDLLDVPERGLPGEQRLRHRDRVAVLLPQGGVEAHARAGGAARRADPRARVLRPPQAPEEGVAASQRRLEPDDRARPDERRHLGRSRRRARRRSRSDWRRTSARSTSRSRRSSSTT